MFIKYEVIGVADGYQEETYLCELTDTEFSVLFNAFRHHSGLDVVTPVIEIYKGRSLPVGPNLAAFCALCSKKYKVPANQFIETLAKVNKNFAEYSKDIERYLILI